MREIYRGIEVSKNMGSPVLRQEQAAWPVTPDKNAIRLCYKHTVKAQAWIGPLPEKLLPLSCELGMNEGDV